MNYTEEQVTLSIINFLRIKDWEILAFDIPQSGTGKIFHPNEEHRENSKNKGSFIPDIVCKKNNTFLIFENKDRFYFKDFKKLSIIRNTQIYSEDIINFLGNKNPIIYFGIGIPYQDNYIQKATLYKDMVDFIICTNLSEIKIIHPVDDFIL